MQTSECMMTIVDSYPYSVESGCVAVAYRTYADDAQDIICGELHQDAGTGEWAARTTGCFGYISGSAVDEVGRSDSMIGAMAFLADWARELIESDRAYKESWKALRRA